MYQREITIRVKAPRPAGLRVVRRGGRKYVVVPLRGDAPRKAEAFDWMKPGNEPGGKEGAWSADV